MRPASERDEQTLDIVTAVLASALAWFGGYVASIVLVRLVDGPVGAVDGVLPFVAIGFALTLALRLRGASGSRSGR